MAPRELYHLRRSKYCAAFVCTPPGFFESTPEHAGGVLREAAEHYGACRIVAADLDAVRLLSWSREHIGIPCFPIPPPDVFETVNNKWRFYSFCVEAGLPVPRSSLVERFDDNSIDRLFAEFPDRFVVKPLELDSSKGVVCIACREDLRRLIFDNPAYPAGPWIAQEFIDGDDVGVDLLAIDGSIVLQATQRRIMDARVVEFFPCPQLVSAAGRFAAAIRFHGAANIDARINARTGVAMLLECNPRPWGSIADALFCGMNFLDYDFMAPAPPRLLESGLSITRLQPFQPELLWALARRGSLRPAWRCAAALMTDPVALLQMAKRSIRALRKDIGRCLRVATGSLAEDAR
jgi:hypothetical protein